MLQGQFSWVRSILLGTEPEYLGSIPFVTSAEWQTVCIYFDKAHMWRTYFYLIVMNIPFPESLREWENALDLWTFICEHKSRWTYFMKFIGLPIFINLSRVYAIQLLQLRVLADIMPSLQALLEALVFKIVDNYVYLRIFGEIMFAYHMVSDFKAKVREVVRELRLPSLLKSRQLRIVDRREDGVTKEKYMEVDTSAHLPAVIAAESMQQEHLET